MYSHLRERTAMIRYALKCKEGHSFESWFKSADAFDALAEAGHLSCSVCGGGGIEKALMAPKVSQPVERPLAAPATEAEKAITALRKKVEESATYVGGSFAKEARAIHDGEKPDRPIWGQATAPEAKSLIEDGIPVAPLPFGPSDKAN
jgi:hypothetical protein